MNLLNNNIIETSINIEYCINKLKYQKSFKIHKEIWYPFIFEYENNVMIYFREDISTIKNPDNEVIKRFKVIIDTNGNIDLLLDSLFELKIGNASHNFRLFNLDQLNLNQLKYEENSLNNTFKIIGIGGQSQGIIEYIKNVKSDNPKYYEYNTNKSNKNLINPEITIYIPGYNQVINHQITCPYFSNGLHLFNILNLDCNYIVENEGLPIITGFHKGRRDGHYGNKNIYENNNGFSVFDSNTNLLFDKTKKKYYLYQRANLGTGIRNIQYSTSLDLIHWSEFNLINLHPKNDLSKTNIYYCNLFSLSNLSHFIGIIPYTEKINSDYNDISKIESYKLYYSYNCVDLYFIGILDNHNYYEKWMICGKPIIINNIYNFFMVNIKNNSIEQYIIESNRMSYITAIKTEVISKCKFKWCIFIDKPSDETEIQHKNTQNTQQIQQIRTIYKTIIINYEIKNDGYLKFQILDKNNNIIDNYSFQNFNILQGNQDEKNKKLMWNNSEDITINEGIIELEGENFSLYAISGQFIL